MVLGIRSERKNKKNFFQSKATLEESSDIFLYQFEITHDKHKKFSFVVELW